MPRAFRQLTAPADSPQWFKTFVADLNRSHVNLATELAKIQGLDGHTPEFYKAPSLRGNPITNVGAPSADDHVVTVADAARNALYKRPTDESHVATALIDAHGGVRVPDAIDLSLVPNLSQLQAAVADQETLSTDQTITGNKTFTGRTTLTNVESTSSDIVVTLATHGLVLKDTQATPHYWRITVSNVGALVTTDIGTVAP